MKSDQNDIVSKDIKREIEQEEFLYEELEKEEIKQQKRKIEHKNTKKFMKK